MMLASWDNNDDGWQWLKTKEEAIREEWPVMGSWEEEGRDAMARGSEGMMV